jgi:ATP-dependent DNA helicase RecG
LEVTSPGPLPFGQTPETLFQPHRSRPWNPLIAAAFYRRGLIEQWGRGTLKIAELVAQAALPPVEVHATPTDVTVCFHHGKTTVRPVGTDLPPLQRRLLEVLAQTGPASLETIMGSLGEGTSRRTVQNNLRALRAMDLVEMTGKGRWARWGLTGSSAS